MGGRRFDGEDTSWKRCMFLVCSSGGEEMRECNVCSSWGGWYGSLSLGWLIFGKMKDSPKSSFACSSLFKWGLGGSPLGRGHEYMSSPVLMLHWRVDVGADFWVAPK